MFKKADKQCFKYTDNIITMSKNILLGRLR